MVRAPRAGQLQQPCHPPHTSHQAGPARGTAARRCLSSMWRLSAHSMSWRWIMGAPDCCSSCSFCGGCRQLYFPVSHSARVHLLLPAGCKTSTSMPTLIDTATRLLGLSLFGRALTGTGVVQAGVRQRFRLEAHPCFQLLEIEDQVLASWALARTPCMHAAKAPSIPDIRLDTGILFTLRAAPNDLTEELRLVCCRPLGWWLSLGRSLSSWPGQQFPLRAVLQSVRTLRCDFARLPGMACSPACQWQAQRVQCLALRFSRQYSTILCSAAADTCTMCTCGDCWRASLQSGREAVRR